MRKDFGKVFLKTAATGMLSLSLAVTPAATAFVSADEVSTSKSSDDYSDVDTDVTEGEIEKEDAKEQPEVIATPAPTDNAEKKMAEIKGFNVKFSTMSTKKVMVNWKSLKKAKGYEVLYSTNKNLKSAKIKKVEYNSDYDYITKLSENKKYYFKVKAYTLNAKNKKVYFAESDIVSISTKKSSLVKTVKEAINKKLTAKKSGYFRVMDFNNDGIPDLLYGKKADKLDYLYVYDGGKMTDEYIYVYKGSGIYSFYGDYKYKNVYVDIAKKEITSVMVDTGVVDKEKFSPGGTVYEKVKFKKHWRSEYLVNVRDMDGEYYEGGNKITKSEFDRKISGLTLNNNSSFMYKNNASNRKKYC